MKNRYLLLLFFLGACSNGTVAQNTDLLSLVYPPDMATPPDLAPSPYIGVSCYSQTCMDPQSCCVVDTDGGVTGTCSNSCTGGGTIAIACDGVEDCPSSSPICCGSVTYPPSATVSDGGVPFPTSGRSFCTNNCTGGVLQTTQSIALTSIMCRTSADCSTYSGTVTVSALPTPVTLDFAGCCSDVRLTASFCAPPILASTVSGITCN